MFSQCRNPQTSDFWTFTRYFNWLEIASSAPHTYIYKNQTLTYILLWFPHHNIHQTNSPNISFLRRFFTTTSAADMSAIKTKVQGLIDDNAVGMYHLLFSLVIFILQRPYYWRMYETVVFSKSYCPYCRASKALLTEMGAKYQALELDQIGKPVYLLTHFLTLCCSPTCPFVFFYTILQRYNHWRKPPDDGSAMQDVLRDLTGQGTVPNIFIKQQHIGGNSDLQAKKKQLPELLKDAGAVWLDGGAGARGGKREGKL